MTRRNTIPLGVTARQHLSPIIEDYHPSRVSLDTSSEKRAHERQVVVAIKNFPEAVPAAVSSVANLHRFSANRRSLMAAG